MLGAIFRKLKLKSLAFYITFALFSALALGVFYRFFPQPMDLIGLTPKNMSFLGGLFLRLIKMIIAPLLVTSIISSGLSVGNAKETGKLALQCVAVFISMTIISVSIGMFSSHFFKPGKNVHFDKAKLVENSKAILSDASMAQTSKITSFEDFILSFIPKNIFEALRSDSFLPIIFFGIMVVMATVTNKELAESSFISGIKSAGEIVLNMSKLINKMAPFGVFGATFSMVASQDVALLIAIAKLVLCIYGSCFVTMYVVYSTFALLVLRLNPLWFFKKIIPAQTIGFLLANSSAALPLSLDIAKNKLGIKEDRANFIVNLGATMNMNGGAIYFGATIFFVSQLYGIELNLGAILFAVVVATFAAVGTAPVPNAAIMMLPGVLASMHLPLEAVAIMFAFERIFNMARAMTNITGDIFSAVLISRFSGHLNEDVYNKK